MKHKYPLPRFEAAVTPYQANFLTKQLNETFENESLDFDSMNLEELEKEIQKAAIQIAKYENASKSMKRLHFFLEDRFFAQQQAAKKQAAAAEYEQFRKSGKFIH